MELSLTLISGVWQKSKEGLIKCFDGTITRTRFSLFQNLQKCRTKQSVTCVSAICTGLSDRWCYSSTSLLALVCEYGVTHYDGWSNYVPVGPLWPSTSKSAQPHSWKNSSMSLNLDFRFVDEESLKIPLFRILALFFFVSLSAHPECWNKDKREWARCCLRGGSVVLWKLFSEAHRESRPVVLR